MYGLAHSVKVSNQGAVKLFKCSIPQCLRNKGVMDGAFYTSKMSTNLTSDWFNTPSFERHKSNRAMHIPLGEKSAKTSGFFLKRNTPYDKGVLVF